VKRQHFLRYLRQQGCQVSGEGARHTRIINPANNRRSHLPRHTEIRPGLIREICKQLDIPPPNES
jgi:mRNA interferase HicA